MALMKTTEVKLQMSHKYISVSVMSQTSVLSLHAETGVSY